MTQFKSNSCYIKQVVQVDICENLEYKSGLFGV